MEVGGGVEGGKGKGERGKGKGGKTTEIVFNPSKMMAEMFGRNHKSQGS